MKAAVWHGQKDIRVEERSLKDVGSNEVKVKVAWAGICGSDMHEYLHGPIFISEEKDNVVLSHEFSGIVEEIGQDVSDIKVGDRIAVYPIIVDNEKDPILDHYFNVGSVGIDVDGGFGEYSVVPENTIVKIPDNVTLEEAALAEPASVSFQAVLDSGIKMGDTVTVYGSGPIGLFIIMAAKAAGATNIIVFDLFDKRLEKAKEVGATHVFNSSNVNGIDEINKIAPNGVDISYEAAGNEATFKQAVETTKHKGTIGVIGAHTKDMSWNPNSALLKGLQLKTSFGYTKETFKRVLDMIASERIPAKSAITSQIELDDIVEKGFETLTNDKSQAKILIKLSGES